MKLHQTKHGSSKRNAASLLYSKLKRMPKAHFKKTTDQFVSSNFLLNLAFGHPYLLFSSGGSSSHFIKFEFHLSLHSSLVESKIFKANLKRIATYFEAKIKTTFMTTLVRSVLEKKVQKIKEEQAEEERQIEIHFISHFDLVDFQYFPVPKRTKVGLKKNIFLIEIATIFHAKTNSLTIVKNF